MAPGMAEGQTIAVGRPCRGHVHRPLTPVLIGFATGIALDGGIAPAFHVWCLFVCAALVAAVPAARWGLSRRVNWLLAACVLIPMGGAWHCLRFRDRPGRHLANLLPPQKQLRYVTGAVKTAPVMRRWERVLISQPEEADGPWVFRLNVSGLSADGKAWRRAAGGLAVSVYDRRPDARVGDRLRFAANVRGNRPATNPGEIGQRLRYARLGSFGTASVVSAAGIEVVRRGAWWGSARCMLSRFRQWLKTRLVDGAGRPLDALSTALIFGDRGGLGPDVRRLLEDSGCVHFLAISGLHVGIFAMFVYALMVRAGVSMKWRLSGLIAAVWLYAAFTGLHISALRAALMLTMAALAPMLGRQHDPVSGLVGAAFIILLISPQQLFSPGFQLSFAAVWGIFYLYRNAAAVLWPWEGLMLGLQAPSEGSLGAGLWRYARHYLLLSGCVWVAIAPLTAFHFHRLSLLTPLLNLVIWPLVLLLILNSFLLVGAAVLGGAVQTALVVSAGLLGRAIGDLLGAAAGLPGFAIHGVVLPAWWLAGFYVMLAVWTQRLGTRRANRLFLLGLAVLGLAYLGVEASARRCEGLKAVVADVGHGQCVILRLPNGPVMLYDAGATEPHRSAAVMGVLRSERRRRIQVLAVSHRDRDHYAFLPDLARRTRIDRVVIPPAAVPHRAPGLDLMVERLGLLRTTVRDGDTINGDGLVCTALHPDDRFLGEPGMSDNERSLVLACEYRGWRMMLTGDAQEHALRRLTADRRESVCADVLLLPHHGAWSDGLAEFVRAVRPRIALASSEKPVARETADTLRDLGAPVWTTARHGAITITFSEHAMTVSGFRSGERRRFERARVGEEEER